MNILIFTNYFPPEIGAASNRISALAQGLKRNNHDVEVIAPLPNYPEGEIFNEYKGSFKVSEKIDKVKAHRFWIYATVSKNFLLRTWGMVSFALSLWAGLFTYIKKKPDVILVQYSPILISFSAMILAKLIPGCKRVLNVSDLWPLSALELGVMQRGMMYSLLEKIEQFNYRNAHLIMGQSNEILEYINDRCDRPLFLYRNLSPAFSADNITLNKYHNGQLKIVYAGLLGVAQGIYSICKNVNFNKIGAEFHIYGAGNEESKIQDFVNHNPDKNIVYHGSVTQKELYALLPHFDASIVPLVKRIFGAVPSKIYELISLGVPLLYCGKGEGAHIIEKNSVGFTSAPKDYETLETNISVLRDLKKKEYRLLLENCVKMTSNRLDFEDQIEQLNHELKILNSV